MVTVLNGGSSKGSTVFTTTANGQTRALFQVYCCPGRPDPGTAAGILPRGARPPSHSRSIRFIRISVSRSSRSGSVPWSTIRWSIFPNSWLTL